MIKNIIAKRYSRVLVESYPKKEFSKLQKTVESLRKFLDENAEIKQFFLSPAVNRKHKLVVLETLVEKFKLDSKIHNFFKLLIENNRIFFLDEIFTDIINALNTARKINIFKLETARKLDKKTVNNIKDFVNNYVSGKIEFEHKINKNLVGGFFVYNNDLALDASIKNNFENFVKEL